MSPQVIFTLSNIISYFRENKYLEVSRTVLKNHFQLDSKPLEEALNYGISNGFFERKTGNIYALKNINLQITEEAYYPSIEKNLSDLWVKDGYKTNEFFLENTSRRDSKIAGRWSRPDFTLISHRKFHWTIGSEFDVVTFEVKRPDACDVLAVFEALAHAAAATKSYVVFPINQEDWKSSNPDQMKRVHDECNRYGIGLILIEYVENSLITNHLIRARKRDLDHERCSSFLDAVASSTAKQTIAQWK